MLATGESLLCWSVALKAVVHAYILPVSIIISEELSALCQCIVISRAVVSTTLLRREKVETDSQHWAANGSDPYGCTDPEKKVIEVLKQFCQGILTLITTFREVKESTGGRGPPTSPESVSRQAADSSALVYSASMSRGFVASLSHSTGDLKGLNWIYPDLATRHVLRHGFPSFQSIQCVLPVFLSPESRRLGRPTAANPGQ
ncbi:hypothetical protein RRG08_037832 [Elysia crispata]|uniref:Uncharacterized protein n=1 Tax=Elysia crispata TaxID=231223 RepID=A0AAE0YVL7_9GAST|nr:hypothetical protein RRG08_037832 [Elysia crispata]